MRELTNIAQMRKGHSAAIDPAGSSVEIPLEEVERSAMEATWPGAGEAPRARPGRADRRLIEGLLARAGVEADGSRPFDIQVHDQRLWRRVLAEGSLGLGEAYMDGWWDCERLDEFFARVVGEDLGRALPLTPATLWLALSARLLNRQSKARAGRVADVHYNLDLDIFEATFDARLSGSCAYWKNAADLDAAQEAKLELVCRKIGLAPDQSVLDIGCGWGAFMGYAAERHGARCVGVTVSSEQVDYGRRRYAGLPVEFRLEDYRDFTGKVDHVVSMGMFEHVGSKNYRRYFESARRAIADNGLFLLHTILANERAETIEPWLDKYIFPGGVLPTAGQIGEACEGLFVVEDVENFGAYYDLTLMAWHAKFQSNRAVIAARHGERFCRMWDYYLLCCAGGFRSRQIGLAQFVLSPKGVPGGWVRPPSP
ncbi:MAG: cyclopropane fatty acyl phospholipid synthase [Caulobacteraceae bacterium]